MYKAVFELKELGTFNNLASAFKVIYDAIDKAKELTWQILETAIWIEVMDSNPPIIYSFYEARDMMCKLGHLVNGRWVK